MVIAGYRINFDALLARLLYRWRGRALGTLALLLILGGVISNVIPPFWNGRAALTIIAAPGATTQVDGRAWPRPIYAGAHQLRASLPDGRTAWAEVTLQAGQTLTVTLPAGLPPPREHSITATAPGMQIAQVWWADGAWRVLSEPAPPTSLPETDGPTAVAQPGQTVAIGGQAVERLSTLDAYAGLADQVHRGSQLREAVYQPGSSPSLGTIEVRGWGEVAQTLPISAPLALLRFAPDGDTLLWAEQVTGGQQVYLARAGGARAPVVAVPGRIARLSWRPDDSAVVLHSIQGDRLTLTLVRLAPSIVAAVVAELPVASYVGALVPLSWDDSGLLWIAPERGAATLWRAPLRTLAAEPLGLLDARAIAHLPDGSLRVVVIQGQSVVIGRYQDGRVIGETIARQVQPAPDLAGIWQGDELLLQSDAQTWLVSITAEERT